MNFEEVKEGESFCSFIKYENTPLLLKCISSSFWKYVKLQDIFNEIILDDINIKYNFRIQPINNIGTIYIFQSEVFITYFAFSEILDFTSQDYTTLSIYGTISVNEGIRLNKNSTDLKCEIIDFRFLRCIVPKSHFEGKKGGYYSLVYVHDSEIITFYEIPPFKVVLNETEPDIDTNIITVEDIEGDSKIGKQGVLALSTDFIDGSNIFDKANIEIQTKFKTYISNIYEESEEYEVNCRLVKFTGEPLLVFYEID